VRGGVNTEKRDCRWKQASENGQNNHSGTSARYGRNRKKNAAVRPHQDRSQKKSAQKSEREQKKTGKKTDRQSPGRLSCPGG